MKKATVYLHASKDSMHDLGVQLGFTDNDLRRFTYACSEVTLELEVDDAGLTTIVKVDGRKIAPKE